MADPMIVATVVLSSGFGLLTLLSSIYVAMEAAADRREKEKDTKIVTGIQVVLQLPDGLHWFHVCADLASLKL